MSASDIPAGTVTFLFTDIEGSTRLWEEYPEAMRLALARHDDLMRAAITAQNGHIFKTIGDAFCAAFPTASEAIAAALTAQLQLAVEEWPAPVKIRVRMALHSGAAEVRDKDYFGQPLNRVARLLATGHGGQTLLSEAAQILTRDLLPEGASLISLGPHRLRDLAQTETIFQLTHAALADAFPPLKTINSVANNLPQQLTSFVGREKELEDIKRLLAHCRLLTITGPGGGGKTRLSLQAAADRIGGFADGVYFVELAPLTEGELVAQTLARTMNLPDESGRTALQTVNAFLQAKQVLLILDNCEHLIAACARVAEAILRACPHVVFLATSREPLSIAGETTYRLPSLSLPDPARATTAESLSQYEAVRLFIERAAAVQPAFTVTNANAPALAQLCVRLDGIPLALELAAARVRSLTVAEIHDRLDDRFRLLKGGSRTALPRQQTLRALIDWSYDLLTDTERRILARFSVFVGGATLKAVERICTDETIEDWEALDLLTSLADKSLIVAETNNDETRYRMLETIRQYARERIQESDDPEEERRTVTRHRDFYFSLVREARPHFFERDSSVWFSLLAAEYENIRATLAAFRDADDGGENGQKMLWNLLVFWITRGYLREGRAWAETLLAHPGAQTPSEMRGWALSVPGILARRQGDFPAAHRWFEEALLVAEEVKHPGLSERAIANLAALTWMEGDRERATQLYEQALPLSRDIGMWSMIAGNLCNLGTLALEQGDFERGRQLLEEARPLYEEQGDMANLGAVLHSLTRIARLKGEYDEAKAVLSQCSEIARNLEFRSLTVHALYQWAYIFEAEGDALRAARIIGAAEALREQIDESLGPTELAESEKAIKTLKAALGEADYVAAIGEGSGLTWQEALDLAIKDGA